MNYENNIVVVENVNKQTIERTNERNTTNDSKKSVPIFGKVDFLALEHCFDLLLETRLKSQLDQQFDRLLGDDVL